MTSTLLTVEQLGVAFAGKPPLPILRDIGFALAPGETLGIVGESGSGKSLLALALMGLLPETARAEGSIRFEGHDLLSCGEKKLTQLHGNRIGMIFQEPLTALNPAMTVGDQIAEGMVWHKGISWKEARREAVRLLSQVRMTIAAEMAKRYPHELSGGQRQRVCIAMAIAMKPALLIADEPTTALDVTVQAHILDLLRELVQDNAMALILISHDLGVVAELCTRSLVLYAGRQMEEAPTRALLDRPRNPYTRALIRALPRRHTQQRPATLQAIAGAVPDFAHLPKGCSFTTRCPRCIDACATTLPGWRVDANGRGNRCLLDERDAP
ncbi:ABC transporter ATP-binding protein [Allorhizobium undicola]|uniref:ABC transporter ATP-binding protein n=1 Tax=Allorhizobium undicola TaxID=78527 RepID=UPI003D34CEC7